MAKGKKAKKDDKPREWTREEMRNMFLDHLSAVVDNWAETAKSGKSVEDVLEGCVFSVLATLDGCSFGLPGMVIVPKPDPDDPTKCKGFVVTPAPHESDKDYHKEQGENWFPEESLENDIGGGLHEEWHKHRPKPEPLPEGSRKPLQPPTMEELECLIGWPRGSEQWEMERKAIELLRALFIALGFGRVPQIALYMRGIWDDPSLVKKHQEARERRMKELNWVDGPKEEGKED